LKNGAIDLKNTAIGYEPRFQTRPILHDNSPLWGPIAAFL